MKIPKNMSEEDTLSTIDIVVNRISPKYTFFGFELDDIKQEAFIICVDALNRYDSKRPLENFLSVNLSNRLKNFVRDNFGNAKDVDKKKITCPATITSHVYNNHFTYDLDIEDIDTKEMMTLIEDELPISLREDYLKFTNGVHLHKHKKDVLINKIKDILREKGKNIE